MQIRLLVFGIIFTILAGILYGCTEQPGSVPTPTPATSTTQGSTSPEASTPTPPTAPKPKTAPSLYTITDKAFRAVQEVDCVTDVQIIEVNDNQFLLKAGEGGGLQIIMGEMVLWGYGAKHTWIGKLVYAGYTFDSDANDPLQFMVDKEKGYIYVKGKGVVIEPDGKKVSLP